MHYLILFVVILTTGCTVTLRFSVENSNIDGAGTKAAGACEVSRSF